MTDDHTDDHTAATMREIERTTTPEFAAYLRDRAERMQLKTRGRL